MRSSVLMEIYIMNISIGTECASLLPFIRYIERGCYTQNCYRHVQLLKGME
jgi:hypothetical protein